MVFKVSVLWVKSLNNLEDYQVLLKIVQKWLNVC